MLLINQETLKQLNCPGNPGQFRYPLKVARGYRLLKVLRVTELQEIVPRLKRQASKVSLGSESPGDGVHGELKGVTTRVPMAVLRGKLGFDALRNPEFQCRGSVVDDFLYHVDYRIRI